MTSPTDIPTHDELVLIAERVMYELLGRRWVWPEVTATEVHSVSGDQTVIRLEGRPVISVDSVTIGNSTKQLEYTLENGHALRLARAYRGYLCGGSPRRVTVVYRYGSAPPLEVAEAIRVLAEELSKSVVGDEDCRLPERVTSITRQGITMTVLDSQEFLDEGKTGIPEIDAAIRRFNPGKAKRPARVYGRMTPPPSRINTTQARP